NAFRLRRSPTLNPRKASEPACRKSRRVIPSQKWTGLSASSLYIAAPPSKKHVRAGRDPARQRNLFRHRHTPLPPPGTKESVGHHGPIKDRKSTRLNSSH